MRLTRMRLPSTRWPRAVSFTWAVIPEECVVVEGLTKLETLKIKVDATRPTSC